MARSVPSAMARDVHSARRGPTAADLTIEAGKDCLEERVLDEPQDDLQRAGPGIFHSPPDLGPGGDLVAWRVLQQLGNPAHQALVRLAQDALVLVLSLVVDVEVGEERLDVAGDLSVLHRQLRIEGERPG